MSDMALSHQHPKLKLIYFDLAVRGELTRLALTYGGIDFDDERIPFSEWSGRKSSFPLGQLPAIELDGEVYVQSMAMARYAGRLSGLYPDDPLQALKVDMVIETVLEVLDTYVNTQFSTAEKDVQAKNTKQAVEVTFPRLFAFIEKSIGGKFVLGDGVCLADIFIFDVVTNAVTVRFPEFTLVPYPNVQAVVELIKATPCVSAYLASRCQD
ncbi:hypothetical protein Poli38472_002379 [Pythium oligandrum]|uniref:Glutathione S-transferase n=1 Tax=Pythium oligandrum TaxID=41045 RepID=A0A8K1CI80_PYTOL|nr:hypothetical protein Poli38472_002379 [Pythium oligandrum]|eukprot:TMW63438.1 hypothetical protein Poli38472_002379 [Pythium oligandrum]